MPIGLPNSLNSRPETLQAQNKVKQRGNKNQRQSQQQYPQQQEQQNATPQKTGLSKLLINKKQSLNLNYLEFIGQMNRITIESGDNQT